MNMHADEKSVEGIVPGKRSNKGGLPPAEIVEGRASPEGNVGRKAAVRTQRRGAASIGVASVRQAARQNKSTRFTALLHHITVGRLTQSYYALERNAAPGADGVTWHAYQRELEENLKGLHARIHKGSYRAQPAIRIFIPKADGSERPLDILCLEDKIVQQAVSSVLQSIYEEDFLGFSYGFRPGRGQHDALDALHVGILRKPVLWVFDADIQGFFSAMSHDWMLRFLEHRIADKRVLRLITKWMKVGYIAKDGRIERNTQGAPQGAVISPLLANIYLHYAFDLWIHQWRQHADGEIVVVRYADDFIVGFQYRYEAEKFLPDLQERLRKFDLALHPKKTRLICFGRRAAEWRKKRGEGKPETFDFLGFTHYCSHARKKKGQFVIGRRTIKKRMVAKLREIKKELRRSMHFPLASIGQWIKELLTGHLNYYAVCGNGRRIEWFFRKVRWLWLRALRRRSQKDRMTWDEFEKRTKRFFPPVKILHPLPLHRFDATTRGRSRMR
jgi:RNA-directed DNA polymerase